MTRKEIYKKLREVFHSKSGCFLSKKSCEELAHEVSSYAETDYLMYSEANKEHLKKAITEELGKKVYKQMNDTMEQTVFADSEEEKKYYEGFGYLNSLNNDEFWEYLKWNEEIKKSDKITPKDLLEIGFKEEYQKPEWEAAGFIYYNYRVMGIDLTSVETTDPDFRVLIGSPEYPVRSLKQLTELITTLEAIESNQEKSINPENYLGEKL